MSLSEELSTAELVFYTWVARSRSESSSFTASALNKLSSSSSSSNSSFSSSSTRHERRVRVRECVFGMAEQIERVPTAQNAPQNVPFEAHFR